MHYLTKDGCRSVCAAICVFALTLSLAAETTVVPAGETLTVTDATASQYAGGIDVRDLTSKAVFETSATPTMSLTGTGVVEKTSTAAWTGFQFPTDFFGTYNVFAGSAASTGLIVGRHAKAVETLVVSNATLTSSGITYLGEAAGRAVIKVLKDGVLRLDGTRTEIGAKQNGYGCGFYVDGGDVEFNNSAFVGVAGHGYLRLGSGSVKFGENLTVYVANAAHGAGIIEVAGGHMDIQSYVNCGNDRNCTGIMHVHGGEVDAYKDIQFPVNSTYDRTNTVGVLLVEKDGRFYATNATAQVYFGTANDSAGIFCLNDGGVVRAWKVVKAIRDNNFAYACLDGGTLEVAPNLAGDGTSTATLFNDFTYAAIHARGFTVDTRGYGWWQEKTAPLTRPFGGGVTSVVWKATDVAKFTGQHLRPSVRIRGDGVGAMAVAEFDPATGTVSGIRIVSPGSGYTWAKAEVWNHTRNYHSLPTANLHDCLVSTSQTGGDFIKKGEGTVTLCAANTYAGDTIIKGGRLNINAANALPADTTVVLAGGILTTSDASYQPKKWAVDYAAGAANYPGTLTFPSDATFEVRHAPTAATEIVEVLQADSIVGRPTLTGAAAGLYRLRIVNGIASCCVRADTARPWW